MDLTPDQIALAQKRREKKLIKQKLLEEKALISTLDSRPWLTIQPLKQQESAQVRVKVLTWNLLAQCLIRRELFPTSDCLKAGQREPMIHEEILRQDADILCLQEVDRLEKLLPILEKVGYSHQYASGPRKKHGCLIAYKKDLYTLLSHKVIFYDDEDLPTDSHAEPRKGNSFRTRNIASLAALQRNGDTSQGVVVATTHLFWHPRYTYERIRQLGLMISKTIPFQQQHSVSAWPCILAGDFNFTPSDPAYSLLFGDALLPAQEELVSLSRVVHASVDPVVLMDVPVTLAKGDEADAEESDPDRVITNARQAKPGDGLFTLSDIVSWFATLPRLRSVYNDGLSDARWVEDIPTYGVRISLPDGRRGFNEPEFTSYTHYWKSVLDYIFILDPKDKPASVSGLLKPPTIENLDPGIPKTRISGSDHIVLVAELVW